MIAWTDLEDDLHGACVPEGHLVYAVGDVHGRADLLGEVLTEIARDAATTLASYDAALGEQVARGAPAEEVRQGFGAALPDAHLAFFRGLALSHAAGGYFFAHAGVRPRIALDRQSPHDLMWIREPFLVTGERFGRIVVHGHTPVRQAEVRPNRIGIDTGAWTTGRLTALRLEGPRRALLTTRPGEPA